MSHTFCPRTYSLHSYWSETLGETRPQKRTASWFSLAIVCREWNFVLARIRYRKLRLQSSCVDNFRDIIDQHSKSVRHIWLDIELPRYGCRICNHYSHNSAGGSIFRRTTTKLFSALQHWEPSTTAEGGVTLELNVFCPSDWEHWFKHFHFDDDGDEEYPGPEPGRLTPTWHDPDHGWDHGQLVQEPSAYAIQRIFSAINPYFPRFKETLPQVHAVTKLVLRRQMHRKLDGYSIEALLGALSCLEHLILEPWRPWKMNKRFSFDSGMLLLKPIPPLSMFAQTLSAHGKC